MPTKVECIEYHPQKNLLALGGYDGNVRLLDTETHEVTQQWPHLEKELRSSTQFNPIIYDIDVNADGQSFLTAGDRMIRVWDWEGNLLQSIHTDATIRAACFRPGAETIASAGLDRKIDLWSLRDGSKLATLKGPTERTLRLEFSPDGSQLASGGGNWTNPQDTTVRIWDVDQGKLLQELKGHSGAVRQIEFDHAGERLVTASDDHTVKWWDLADGKRLGNKCRTHQPCL